MNRPNDLRVGDRVIVHVAGSAGTVRYIEDGWVVVKWDGEPMLCTYSVERLRRAPIFAPRWAINLQGKQS